MRKAYIEAVYIVRVPEYRFRGPRFDFPVLPDFLRSIGFGTESTQPYEDK
jgi:hypothetical protein